MMRRCDRTDPARVLPDEAGIIDAFVTELERRFSDGRRANASLPLPRVAHLRPEERERTLFACRLLRASWNACAPPDPRWN